MTRRYADCLQSIFDLGFHFETLKVELQPLIRPKQVLHPYRPGRIHLKRQFRCSIGMERLRNCAALGSDAPQIAIIK